MTHDSAVRTVVNLVPEIEKRGAADVLTEYAIEEDLPPAQLEKLGQLYNTLRTVSHIDNADTEERGATVPLLDVPELVVGYATQAGKEKTAASPLSVPSHDPRMVDLNAALEAEMFGGRQEKAASQVTSPPDEAEENFRTELSREKSAEAFLDLSLDLQDEMSKLAGELFSAAPKIDGNHFSRDISEMEEEALRKQPSSAVKAAGDYLEKFAEPHRTKLARFGYDREIQKYAYEITHDFGDKMAELAQVLGTFNIVKRAAEGDEEIIDQLNGAIGASPDEGSFIPPPIDPSAVDPKAKEETSESASEKIDENKAEGLASDSQQRPQEGGGSGDKREGKGDDKRKDSGKEKGISGEDVAGVVAAPLKAVGEGVQGAAQRADEVLSRVVSKDRENKAQKATDLSVNDIKRAMNLRRLIGTDPVLKEADPKEVLDIYNAIAARNPDLANDMASLRLVLREAVSYEGLTLDSQKLLSEIYRNSSQGEKETGESDKKRYAVGGANPLPIAQS